MSRDIKLNAYQLTKAQLKKKMKVYLQKYRGGKFDRIFEAVPVSQDDK